MVLFSFPPVPVASAIAPTPLSSGFVVTSAYTIQVTTQPPFIGKLTIGQLFNIHNLLPQAAELSS